MNPVEAKPKFGEAQMTETIDTAALAKLAAERFEQSADASFIDDALTVVLFSPLEWRALAALLRGVVWQPIETAPKDGRHILLWLPEPWGLVEKARWYGPWNNWQVGAIPADPMREEYFGLGSSVPTHWMPLPSPPLSTTKEG